MARYLFAFCLLAAVLVGIETKAAGAAPRATDVWTPHSAYHDGKECVVAGQYLYALMGENLLIYDRGNDAVAFVDRVGAGLSAKRILHIGYSRTRRCLVLLYADGNIDLYFPASGHVVNLPQIARAASAEITVQRLRVQNDDAFVTTDRGFARIDLARREFVGHFPLQPCYDVVRMGDSLFAATAGEVRSAGLRQNLSDPAQWSVAFSHTVRLMAPSSGALYLNVPGSEPSAVGTWRINARAAAAPAPADFERIDLLALDELHTDAFGAVIGRNDRTFLHFADTARTPQVTTIPSGLNWIETAGDGSYWVGRDGLGFGLFPSAGTTFDFSEMRGHVGGYGPRYDRGYFMKQQGARLLVACGRLDPYDAVNTPQMSMLFENARWSFFDTPRESEGYVRAPFQNATSIAQSPLNPDLFAVTTARTGVYLYKGTEIQRQYTYNNSPLVSAEKRNAAAMGSYVRTDGAIYDRDGNLFVLNNSADTAIWVLRPDGTWKGVYNGDVANAPTLEKTLFDRNGRLWVSSRRTVTGHAGGFLCLDYNHTVSDTDDDVARYRSEFVNQDGTPCPFTQGLAVAEDRDGAVWLGTNQGIFKVEDPARWFDNDFRVTQVKVPRNDGTDYADYLLAGVPVTAIAVDGANRKWIGTTGDGVYLLSADGTKTIRHFKKDNSPLFSDDIWSIACNPNDGSVMISTDAGMLAYRGDATEPVEALDRGSVRVFPNPFRPKAHRDVTLEGLTHDADIRVTTASGTLVASGRSEGGMFRWDGRDSRGVTVASGIYYFYIADAEGRKGITAKVAVVR